VLTNFTDTNSIGYYATVTSSVIAVNGFHLSATNTSSTDLGSKLSVLPTFVAVYDTRRSLSDDRLGYQWTIVYEESAGDIPGIVCGMDPALTAAFGNCQHFELVKGNVLGGHFVLSTGAILSYDVTAADMQSAFEQVYGENSVSVARIGPDNQSGYTWSITWLTATATIPALSYSSQLTGSGAKIVVKTVQNGNFLGGSFYLGYNNDVTKRCLSMFLLTH